MTIEKTFLDSVAEFWVHPEHEVLHLLNTDMRGLSSEEASKRLEAYGKNELKPKRRTDNLTQFLSQFKSPLILLLIAAAVLSFFLGDIPDALIILAIILASGTLGFWQERSATDAVRRLLETVEVKTSVMRDGQIREVSMREIVPGDIVLLDAGNGIPADCLILQNRDLFVDESALTGETFAAEKSCGALPVQTPLAKRSNTLFMGTHVISGTATAVVVKTGKSTELGKISERLRTKLPDTEFQRGVRRFGYLLMEVTLVLVLVIFAANVYLHRPVLISFLFSLGLAVGLTPQLLPAIISINLAQGAKRMAQKKVIVKRLDSIENFGSMNVLCSDKTGTLTEGVIRVHSAINVEGKENQAVLLYAFLNSVLQTGFKNPLDKAIQNSCSFDVNEYEKLDEIPYDFIRKRLSILVKREGTHLMITKGALQQVLDVCSSAETSNGRIDISAVRDQVNTRYEELSNQGFRTLGVAYRTVSVSRIDKGQESAMTFLGILTLFDPPKEGVIETLRQLRGLGITLRMITGDNRLIATYVSQQTGLKNPVVVTGLDLHQMSNQALMQRTNEIDVYAEVEPNQKEQIILSMKKAGHVVGYLGDGINDATALHAADVGISVDSAVDVAKEAADLVLLEKNLDVLVHGVKEGRRTFANTLKYVFMATSANFGNMFSMAGASLFLSFLPLLPKQILLTNLLTDFPEMTIATDHVDPEMLEKPRRWNVNMIRKFMIVFGITSSVFDYLTFGVLLFFLHATPDLFRTGWFVESVVSAALVVLVVRTRKSFFHSKPASPLLVTTLLIVLLTLLMPSIPFFRNLFGFKPLPLFFYAALGVVVMLYVITAEIVKHYFYRRVLYN